MTLLFDRLISDSGLELARVFDDSRYDIDDVLDEESVQPARGALHTAEAHLQ